MIVSHSTHYFIVCFHVIIECLNYNLDQIYTDENITVAYSSTFWNRSFKFSSQDNEEFLTIDFNEDGHKFSMEGVKVENPKDINSILITLDTFNILNEIKNVVKLNSALTILPTEDSPIEARIKKIKEQLEKPKNIGLKM